MTFTIHLANQAIQFACADDQSILDAAIEHGVALSYGCRDGLCASCKAKLISGQIDYPDGKPDGISDEEYERGETLLCKAIPRSDVTLKVKVIQQQADISVKTLPARVKQIDHLTDDVMRLILQLPAVEPFRFRAGQWVYFVLKDGRKRAFSIANAPNENNELELQIRHAVGGVFTDFVFNNLKTGALLRIEGPHGAFYYQQDDCPLLLVAGGTGFAPLKGIYEEIRELGLQQRIHLFWGSRAKKDLYQEDLIQQWIARDGIQYTPVLSQPVDSDLWQGETGFVHEAVIRVYPDLSDFAVYMAGPPQMIESCKSAFMEAGADEARLHYDSFDYSSDALNAMKGK